jgi:hypothetical protein
MLSCHRASALRKSFDVAVETLGPSSPPVVGGDAATGAAPLNGLVARLLGET